MEYSQDDLDNHANQLNPNNDAYWQSRGLDERPDDWDDISDTECYINEDDFEYEPWCSDDFE